GINVLAVGNAGKMYRSGNGGVTYTSTTVAGTPNLNSLSSFGTDVWIAGASGNVYKTMITSSPINIYNVGSGADLKSVKFINANTGYVCGDGGLLLKTSNGGINWFNSNSGISGENLSSIDFNGNNGTVVGASGSVYYTTNAGSTWLVESSGVGTNLLKIKYFGTDRVITGEYGVILKNTGSGWTDVVSRTNKNVTGLTGSAINDVHVCGGGGFIRNNKNSSNNFFNFEMNPMLADLKDIFYYDNNKGWAVSSLNRVIIYTTNGGATWSMPTGSSVSYNWVSKPGASGSFLGNNLCAHPYDNNTFFVAFGNTVYVSRNRGESWSSVGNNYPGSGTPHSFFVSPLDTNIWLVANQSSTDIVARSTNYGSTWTTVLTKNFSNYGQPLEIDQNNPSVFYFAPDGGGFWKSTNSGASFTEISGNYPFRSPCEILVTWDNPNVIILGDGVTSSSNSARMFKSTNGGVDWINIDSTESSETPSMCNTVFDKNIIWCTEWSGSNIYKSTDMGSSYTIHRSTGFSGWGSDVCREDPNVVITGSWGAAATITTNGGANWTNINTGLSGHGGGILIAERGLILAQQGSNVYKLNITYTDNPVVASIDVQALSLNGTGDQFFNNIIINPTGTVKNNNGAASATFNVTRKISPGGYISTKNVANLLANGETSVTFDPWTFSPGVTYTVKDSVYITDDINPGNDVISGTITPYLGEGITRVNQDFNGSYPPKNWTFDYTGTIRWVYNSVSAYNIGTGSSKFDFWNANNGTNQSLLTPDFPASVSGDSLKYDYSYSPYTGGAVDSLIIEYSTDGGSSYSELARFRGKNTDVIGEQNSMVTTTASGNSYTPSQANQWLPKSIALPVGTNKIKFRARSGYGNNLYVDNVNISTFRVFTLYNVKLSPEGYYNGTTQNMSDTVKVYLRNTVSPFAVADSATAVIDSVTNNAGLVFRNVTTGTYYLQISHRNSLETWSKSGGESISAGVTGNYDFTTSASQGYGNNLILISGKYCLYGGDINRDGLIELSDLLQIYNDGANFALGYVLTDLTGDRLVDLTDLLIVYNNASNFVSKNTPESAPSQNDASRERSRNELKNYFSKISNTSDSK
ncbi:MAG: hypothetical protein KDD00_16755, partial [Ignavibacteriae bacterium]|nr:hypothetical protein [Ignavibacteriota bacterium]